ncbi:MAG TPA: hypothetical protein VF601_23185 [Beijerinckiaceae bacterium]|jgi:hypothetical protein
MPRFLAEEVVARVRELYEGAPLTHARIAAAAGVGESTVSVLARKHGWTRCPEARTSRRLSHDQYEAILRLRDTGASARSVAAAAGCHARTVGRIAPPDRRAAAFGTGAASVPGAARSGAAAEAGFAAVPPPVPEHLADLHAALVSPDLRKAEAAPLLVRAAAALGAEALVRPDAQVERTAQALARLALRVAALPDEGPYAGAGADDRYRGPATFDEANELLEEIARRYEAFVAREDAEAEGKRAGPGTLAQGLPEDDLSRLHS